MISVHSSKATCQKPSAPLECPGSACAGELGAFCLELGESLSGGGEAH